MKHNIIEVAIYSMFGIGLVAIIAGFVLPGVSAMFIGVGAVVMKNQYYPRLTNAGREGAQDSEYCMLCRRACAPYQFYSMVHKLHCKTGREGVQDSEYCMLCHRGCPSHC